VRCYIVAYNMGSIAPVGAWRFHLNEASTRARRPALIIRARLSPACKINDTLSLNYLQLYIAATALAEAAQQEYKVAAESVKPLDRSLVDRRLALNSTIPSNARRRSRLPSRLFSRNIARAVQTWMFDRKRREPAGLVIWTAAWE